MFGKVRADIVSLPYATMAISCSRRRMSLFAFNEIVPIHGFGCVPRFLRARPEIQLQQSSVLSLSIPFHYNVVRTSRRTINWYFLLSIYLVVMNYFLYKTLYTPYWPKFAEYWFITCILIFEWGFQGPVWISVGLIFAALLSIASVSAYHWILGAYFFL